MNHLAPEALEPGRQASQPAVRLALSGPVGAGKSTLAQALAARLGVRLIPEGFAAVQAAIVGRSRLLRNPQATDQHLQAAHREAMAACLAWLQGRERVYAESGGFVADRWEVDLLDTWLKLFAGLSPDAQTRAILARMREVARGLDLVVLLPPPAFDVERFNDEGLPRRPGFSLKLQAYAMTSGLLRQCQGLRVLALPEGQPVAARVDAVLRALSRQDARISGSGGS